MREFILHYWVQELLHDRLYRSCGFFISRGYCTVEDRRNLECLYTPYKSLGGDGTGDSLYNKCMELPLSEDKGKED